MDNKTKIYIGLSFVIIIAIIFLPIELPQTVNSKGKLISYQTWTLEKGRDGELIASLTDNSTGLRNEISVTQFDRGDAFQFKLNKDLINKGNVTSGDTIGFLISNVIEREIQKLKGELETTKALLRVQSSSEKESIIEAEKKQLSFAEKKLDEQEKIYNRKKQLFEKELISQQEYEADAARYELAKINIEIAKEKLKTVQSGAKEEKRNFTTSQIKALENEIYVLQKRFESNNITIPISGIVNRTFSKDTLLIVNDISKAVVTVPVKWSEFRKLNLNQNVLISALGIDEEIIGEVIEIDNSVKMIQNVQYVMVTVLSEEKINYLKPGLIVDCEIDCGYEKLIDKILNFVEPIFN